MKAADDIRARRSASNRAIGARDAELVVTFMMPNVSVHVAGGPLLVGREASRAAFASKFANKHFLGYTRDPDEIVVADGSAEATERGRWTGRWRAHCREETMRGTYVAVWQRTELGWLIESERFETTL